MTIRELLIKFPDLKILADQASDNRAIFVCQKHANGTWGPSVYLPTTDKNAFYRQVIASNDGITRSIRIRITKDAMRQNPAILEREIHFSADPMLGNPGTPTANQQLLEELDRKLSSKDDGENSAITELRNQFTEMRHNMEMDKLKALHLKDIEALQKDIAAKNQEIEELQEQLTTTDAQLSGMERESKGSMDKWVKIGGAMLGAGIENAVKQNPWLLTKGLGIPEEVVQEHLFSNEPAEQIAGNAERAAAPVADSDEYEGVNADQKTLILHLLNAMKKMEKLDFDMFIAIVKMMFDKDGVFLPGAANDILDTLLKEIQNRTKTKTESPTT